MPDVKVNPGTTDEESDNLPTELPHPGAQLTKHIWYKLALKKKQNNIYKHLYASL